MIGQRLSKVVPQVPPDAQTISSMPHQLAFGTQAFKSLLPIIGVAFHMQRLDTRMSQEPFPLVIFFQRKPEEWLSKELAG